MFKIGDKLKCVRTDGVDGEYSLNSIYTVEKLDVDGLPILRMDGGILPRFGLVMNGLYWEFESVTFK